MREVIKRDPKYAQAYNALGFTYADRNIHLKESRALLEKALSLLAPDCLPKIKLVMGSEDKSGEQQLKNTFDIT
jgi:hypothetical protein